MLTAATTGSALVRLKPTREPGRARSQEEMAKPCPGTDPLFLDRRLRPVWRELARKSPECSWR